MVVLEMNYILVTEFIDMKGVGLLENESKCFNRFSRCELLQIVVQTGVKIKVNTKIYKIKNCTLKMFVFLFFFKRNLNQRL